MDGNVLDLEREKFKAIVSGVHEGVILLDTQQRVISANERACAITGYKLNELLGKQAADVLYIFDKHDNVIDPNLLCPLGGVDMEGVIYKGDNLSLVDKEQSVKLINIQSRKIAEGSKIDLGAMVIIDDVYVEGELERMKSDFVSMAVHMLRTPLTVIKGFLSTLVKIETVSKLDRDELENLTNAIAGTDELSMLIENLLHLSEIQTGQFKIHTADVNYEGLIASIVNDFKPVVEAKDLKLIYVPPLYGIPMLRLDFGRMKEVLRNLVDNAIKFTDTGGIEINVFKEDGHVHTTIKDTGKGIPATNLEYIFTKFYRIKDPLEMEKGLGLGLFVCKQIIEAHQGKIWAESEEGSGTTMHFTLPIV